jgi:hypothetical protein
MDREPDRRRALGRPGDAMAAAGLDEQMVSGDEVALAGAVEP